MDDEYAGCLVVPSDLKSPLTVYLGKARDGAIIKFVALSDQPVTILPDVGSKIISNKPYEYFTIKGAGSSAEAVLVNGTWVLTGDLVLSDLTDYMPMFYDIEAITQSAFVCRVKYPKNNAPKGTSMQFYWKIREVGSSDWVVKTDGTNIINGLTEGKLIQTSFGSQYDKFTNGKEYEISILPFYTGSLELWSPVMRFKGPLPVKKPIISLGKTLGKGSAEFKLTNLDSRFDSITVDIQTTSNGTQYPNGYYRVLQNSKFTNNGDGTGSVVVAPIYAPIGGAPNSINFNLSWSVAGSLGTGWVEYTNMSGILAADLPEVTKPSFLAYTSYTKTYREVYLVPDANVLNNYDTIITYVDRSPDWKFDVKPTMKLFGAPVPLTVSDSGDLLMGSISNEPSGGSKVDYYAGGFFALRKKGTNDWTFVSVDDSIRCLGFVRSVAVPALNATGIVDLDGKIAASFTAKPEDIESKYFAGYEIQYMVDDGAWVGTKVDRTKDDKIELIVTSPGKGKKVTIRARQISTQNGASPWTEVSLVVT